MVVIVQAKVCIFQEFECGKFSIDFYNLKVNKCLLGLIMGYPLLMFLFLSLMINLLIILVILFYFLVTFF